MLNISTELGNKVCHHYRTERTSRPPELQCGHLQLVQLTTWIMTLGPYHQATFTMPDGMATMGAVACLPETYTSIPPAAVTRQDLPVPKQEGPNKVVCQQISQAMQKEYN